MRILGIDPGTGRTGYGVIDLISSKNTGYTAPVLKKKKVSDNIVPKLDELIQASLISFGCIETPKEDAMSHRLVSIRIAIKDLLKTYKPDAVSIELLFFGINTRTAMTVGQARGVILEAIAGEDIPIFEYQGLSVKRLISGSGKAEKKEMQEIMRRFFNLEVVPKPDDAADGLAIALCHALNSADQS